MEKVLTIAAVTIFWVLLPASYLYLVGAWLWWARLPTRFEPPKWRSLLAFAAFLLSSGSALWSVVLIVHAFITGGFRYYHPVLLASIRFGLLASIASIVLGALGKGAVRVPAIVVAVVMMLVWFGEAVAQ